MEVAIRGGWEGGPAAASTFPGVRTIVCCPGIFLFRLLQDRVSGLSAPVAPWEEITGLSIRWEVGKEVVGAAPTRLLAPAYARCCIACHKLTVA